MTRSWLGLHLGGSSISVGEIDESSRQASSRHRTPSIPPALVLSPGGAPEFSDQGPIPLAGAGLAWPPSAAPSPAATRPEWGRIPVADIWSALHEGDNSLWGGHSSVRASTGLALAAKAALAQDRAREVCVVIPNSLDEEIQGRLIEAFEGQGLKAVLLWRPIAAAMSWLRRYASEYIRDVEEQTVVGSLLTLHLGTDGVEATWLELILDPRAPSWLLPARQRPQGRCEEPTRGREWLRSAIDKAIVGGAQGGREESVWRALWASPLLLDLFPGTEDARNLTQWGLPGSSVRDVQKELEGRSSVRFLLDNVPWLEDVRARLGEMQAPLGVVVTGDLAACAVKGGVLGALIAENLLPKVRSRTLIEGTESLPMHALARNAATYAMRRHRDDPTYLDTLPAMEALIEQRARPVWRSLIEHKERYVRGGRVWQEQDDLGGLSIPANAREFALSLWVEPGEEVRQVKFQLPEPPERTVSVKLDIRVEPAQGQPRVELLPVKPGALGRGAIVLNWRRAERTGKNREDVAKDYPRKCPQDQPRQSWQSSARDLRLVVQKLSRLDAGLRRKGLNDRYLTELKDALNKGPQGAQIQALSTGPIGIYRSLNSEGGIHPLHEGCLQSLRELLHQIGKVELASARRNEEPRDLGLRVLGYGCATGPVIDELVESFVYSEYKISPGGAVFLAGCARDPKHIALFLEDLLGRFVDHEGISDMARLAGYILQWREDALDETDSKTAEQLARRAGEKIAAKVERSRGGAIRGGARLHHIERNCIVLIAFLLRRRIADDAFLRPNGRVATELKRIFSVTEDALRRGKITSMGGMVKTDLLIQRVIQYIERKGTGTILAD